MHTYSSAIHNSLPFCTAAPHTCVRRLGQGDLHQARKHWSSIQGIRSDLTGAVMSCNLFIIVVLEYSQEDFAMVDAFGAGIHKEVQAAVVRAGQANNIEQPVASCGG